MPTSSQNILAALQARYGSADWSKWMVQRWCFYDYIRYPAAGTTQLQFFANATGSTDPVSTLAKTLEQTNIPKARSLGQNFFFINQIRCDARFLPKPRQHATIAADADVIYTTMTDAMSKFLELTRRGVLNITIGQKKYWDIEQPFQNAPPGYGIHITEHSSHSITENTLWGECNPSRQNIYDVTPPQLVEPEQTLDVTIDFPTTSPVFTGLVDGVDPNLEVGVIFDGYIVRPAQ